MYWKSSVLFSLLFVTVSTMSIPEDNHASEVQTERKEIDDGEALRMELYKGGRSGREEKSDVPMFHMKRNEIGDVPMFHMKRNEIENKPNFHLWRRDGDVPMFHMKKNEIETKPNFHLWRREGDVPMFHMKRNEIENKPNFHLWRRDGDVPMFHMKRNEIENKPNFHLWRRDGGVPMFHMKRNEIDSKPNFHLWRRNAIKPNFHLWRRNEKDRRGNWEGGNGGNYNTPWMSGGPFLGGNYNNPWMSGGAFLGDTSENSEEYKVDQPHVHDIQSAARLRAFGGKRSIESTQFLPPHFLELGKRSSEKPYFHFDTPTKRASSLE